MIDMDFVARGLKPTAPDPAAIAAMDELNMGDYEIYAEKLNMILEEGKRVMTMMGISSMLHSGDTMAGIYTKEGDLVTTACGTYLHCVTGQIPVKFVLKFFADDPTVGVKEGDVFYCNEAIYGGIHNPDQFAFMPIFHQDELVAWVVVGAHQSETGAKEPGGEITSAVSRHDEGMKLTPIKIGENYKLKTDILKMMENFISRAARMQVTDVKARVAACDRIRIRIQELAKRRSPRFLMGLFQKMIKESEEGARERIRGWNDGTYRHTVFIDTTGGEASLLRVPVALTKKGDRLLIDLTGASPEHEGSFQALAPAVRAHCAVNLYQGPFHDFPISAGTMEPIDFIIPHGTIMDPDPEAAISCAPITASAIFPALAVAISKMAYASEQRDLVCGFCSSNSSGPMIACETQHGARVVDFMGFPLNAWGLAARHDCDGIDVFGFPHGPWGKAPDVEDIERAFPLLHLYQKTMPESCGYGRYRGGMGATIAYTVHQVPYAIFTATTKESKFPTHSGLFGGYSETVVPAIRVVGTNAIERMKAGTVELPSNDYDVVLNNSFEGEIIMEHQARPACVVREGEIICSSTQGGGGYGDVLERSPEEVVVDVSHGVISIGTAERIFNVIINPETFKVDADATEAKREETRKARLRRGKLYDDFNAQWSKLRPHPQALKFFGSWPDAKPNRQVIRI